MRLLVTAVVGALVLTSASTGATGFDLRPAGQTGKTATFTWTRQSRADGYRFLRNGVVVSQTFDPSITKATFWRGGRYTVQVLHRGVGGQISLGERASVRISRRAGTRGTAKPRAAKLVFQDVPRIDFRLRVASRTMKTITFAWKRQPSADGYEFVRDGVVVSRTFEPSTTTATFWKGSQYAVRELRRTPDKKSISVRRATVYATPVGIGSGHKRLVSVAARKVDFALRVASRTAKTITFRGKRQAGADGYE